MTMDETEGRPDDDGPREARDEGAPRETRDEIMQRNIVIARHDELGKRNRG